MGRDNHINKVDMLPLCLFYSKKRKNYFTFLPKH